MVKVLGEKFGMLTAIKLHHKDKYNTRYWVCLCDCGTELVVRQDKLRSGQTTCCGCKSERKRNLWHNIKAPIGIKRRYQAYRIRSEKTNIKFALTPQEFYNIISEPCSYCGSKDGKHTIDRIDSSLGYTKDNVVPACLICNIAKSDTTLKDFFKWIDKVYKHIHKI